MKKTIATATAAAAIGLSALGLGLPTPAGASCPPPYGCTASNGYSHLPAHDDAQYWRTHGSMNAPDGVVGFNNSSGRNYLKHGLYNTYGVTSSYSHTISVAFPPR